MAFEFKEKAKEPLLSPAAIELIERSHQNSKTIGYDDIELHKHIIMDILTKDQDILHTLHRTDLEEKYTDPDGIINGDAYRDEAIFSFLKIPETQSTVRNFICFDVDDIEPLYNNDAFIKKQIIFRTISHDEDYKTDWGINRQDLLAALIKNKFDWSNVFGLHVEKVRDRARTAENGYYYREFIYEATTPNALFNKTRNAGGAYGNLRSNK